jgi:hypothetical protein
MLYIFYTKYIILGLTAKVKYRHISVPKEQTYQTFQKLPASQNQMMMFHSVSSVKLIRESTLSSMLLFLKK